MKRFIKVPEWPAFYVDHTRIWSVQLATGPPWHHMAYIQIIGVEHAIHVPDETAKQILAILNGEEDAPTEELQAEEKPAT